MKGNRQIVRFCTNVQNNYILSDKDCIRYIRAIQTDYLYLIKHQSIL